MKRILSLIAVLFSTLIFAQTVVTGTVTDEDNNPIPGANVVLDSSNGAVADFDGNFSITVNQNPPFDLTISSVGFDSVTINVTSASLNYDIQLVSSKNLLDEIVISASRTPERLFESAVTIEKFDYKDIAMSTGPDFYSSLTKLKGVQVNQGGLLMQQVNTRGFSTIYNEGFVQLVDGMNNEAPGLSFSAGNLLGINELDIQSVELMPGAGSALYGANAVKGIMFMNSKNPFDFPGVSVSYRQGVTSQKAAGDNYYYDIALRAAQKFSDKFAAKVTVSYVEGEDWHAADYSDLNHLNNNQGGAARWQHTTVSSTGHKDNFVKYPAEMFPDYNGVNVYGDVGQAVDMDQTFIDNVLPLMGLPAATAAAVTGALQAAPYFGTYTLNASGYKENQLIDNKASSMKADVALHYKLTEDSEIIINSKVGQGNTMLHATNRNMLKNFGLQQHKIEYNNKNLTMRLYTSIEDSGNTHDTSMLGANMVFAQPGGVLGFFGKYFGSYFGASGILANMPGAVGNPVAGATTLLGDITGQIPGRPLSTRTWGNFVPDDIKIHAAARKAAETNMLVPGSAAWDKQYRKSISTGMSLYGGGAGILDNSKSDSFEINYNLQDLVSIADVIIGASHRKYTLRSNGTLFTDYNEPIVFVDQGLYAQAKKSFGALTLTGSMRYDKSQYFDGHITPRIGGILAINKNQNIRFSYQTGYQNPSSQDQYIGLDVTQTIFMGTSPDNIDRFKMDVAGVSDITKKYTLTGRYVVENAWTLNSALQAAGAAAAANVAAGGGLAGQMAALGAANALLVKADLGSVEPQYVKSYDFGYRINGKKTAFDINVYLTQWDNFIAAKNVITPMYDAGAALGGTTAALLQSDFRVMSVDSNTDEVVTTHGVSGSFETSLFDTYDLNVTSSFNKMEFDDPTSDYEAGFNTPSTRVRVSLGSDKLAENMAFNVSMRYHNGFLWQQSGFPDGRVPENTVFDASVNFAIPSVKGNIKIGGTNLFGDEYMPFIGTGAIGQQYYVGFTLNP
jgi:outer membrane receptor protein involved in Fe transport